MVMSSDPKEAKLVKELIIRLAEEQEVLWIEEIIGDFVNKGGCILMGVRVRYCVRVQTYV